MSRRHQVLAQAIAERLPGILAARGLEPAFRRFVVVVEGRGWLFAELDLERAGRMERYVHPDVLHQIRAALGRPVYISNTAGLRYAFPLDEIPPLPPEIPFPGLEAGVIRIGMTLDGEARVPLDEWGHGMVAGLSGYGKSNFLRLVALQVRAQGGQVLAMDPHGDLFGIAHRAWEMTEAPAWLAAVEGILELRRRGGDRSPLVLAVADEVSSAILLHGGPRGGFARRLAAAIWQGRKFGVRFLLALHEVTREVVGLARDAAAWRVAFRLATAAASRAFLGQAGAERIRIPGRAIAEPWGVVQTYRAPEGEAPPDPSDRALLEAAVRENGGVVTLEWLTKKQGLPEREARRRLRAWRAAGWVEKDPARLNAHVVTARAPGVPTSEPSEPVQAVQTIA